jgi:WD40 repeat protein
MQQKQVRLRPTTTYCFWRIHDAETTSRAIASFVVTNYSLSALGWPCVRSRRGQQRRCRLPRAHGNEPVFSVVNVGGTQVATAGGDRSVCLWDCLSGAVLQKWNEAHGKEVARLALVASTSDNTTLASGTIHPYFPFP